MKSPYLDAFISASYEAAQPKVAAGEVISVNETVSAAASVYESIRNSLEFDEEHLLRRNAIRRILKRHFGEEDLIKLSTELLQELIWARYLGNKQVSIQAVDDVADILKKYKPLFDAVGRLRAEHKRLSLWLMDVLSAEIEYRLSSPVVEEALATFAYQDLKARMDFGTPLIKPEDRDLQLYISVHRAVLKSNVATLRYRIFTLFYPDWTAASTPALVETVSSNFVSIVKVIESHMRHPAQDRLFRFVQRQTVVFHILRDIVMRDPAGFAGLLDDPAALQKAIVKASADRYDRFRLKVRRTIIRAIAFLLLTKTTLALLIELPYDLAVAKTTSFIPLIINILFHPALLGVIGLTVTIPEEKNTLALQGALHRVVGLEDPQSVKFVTRRPWMVGGARRVFDALYALGFVFTIVILSTFLHRALGFNALSIVFFLFFLSLVTFFGLKIRGSRREVVIIEGKGSFLTHLFDVFFLPIVRAGRWMSLRAPRINVFLFFFDFIIEAPFKAAIKLIEGWLAFLREKKEEI